MNSPELKQKIKQLRQSVLRYVEDGSDVPELESVVQFRKSCASLRQEIASLRERGEALVKAKQEYETREKQVDSEKKELGKAQADLEQLAARLGKAAFGAFKSEKIGQHPSFADRIANYDRVEQLRGEHDV